jgi:hypothetical protein
MLRQCRKKKNSEREKARNDFAEIKACTPGSVVKGFVCVLLERVLLAAPPRYSIFDLQKETMGT